MIRELQALRLVVDQKIETTQQDQGFQQVFDGIPLGMITIAPTGEITLVNRKAEQMFGYTRDELFGKLIEVLMPDHYQMHHPKQRNDFFRKPKVRSMGVGRELFGKRKNGEEFPLEIGLTPIQFLGDTQVLASIIDISERKASEKAQKLLRKQFYHAQKVEALGTLSGGIAHDFNNILNIILASAKILKLELAQDEDKIQTLDQITKAGNRATDLIKQILTFSRMDQLDAGPVDLAAVVQEAIAMARATIPRNIEINKKIQENLPQTVADASQIHQVVLNLCINAFHAMEKTGGSLDISLSTLEECCSSKGLEIERCYRLTVEDTGHGIAAEHLEKVFDPFYTTKGVDKGTGLGLSVVHGVIEKHAGKITVKSPLSEQGGTLFSIYLPMVEVKDKIKPREASKASSIDAKPSSHLLIVEDELSLVKLYRRFFEKQGFVISHCDNGADALKLIQSGQDQFDLVLTDYSLPQMTGKQLAQTLVEIQPDLPIILMTGYSDVLSKNEAESMGIRHYLMKPIDLEVLQEAIESCLLA